MIEIYTYQDPYKLNKEAFWEDIRNCPYFCASQTLVNGLKSIYGESFTKGRCTTIYSLIQNLFKNWESTSCKIKQHAAIDNIINMGFDSSIYGEQKDNLLNAFRFNRDEVFKSIRILFEMNIQIENIEQKKLNKEQVFIVDLYKKILNSPYRKLFDIKDVFTEEEITLSIIETMKNTVKEGERFDLYSFDTDKIVIHGIHQFTPVMLRMIDEISKYKRVIILFNYQSKYENVYQTWINIYELFDLQINISNKNPMVFDSSKRSIKGNILGDNIGKLANGNKSEIDLDKDYEVMVFDNMTEFAGYISNRFEKAKKAADETGRQPLSEMNEQFYSADSSVNEILKVYFPEQFGERHFLNYPLGRFFVSIANMWDSKKQKMVISDLNDIRECLCAGIIKEDNVGELSTIFEKCIPLIDGCEDIEQMISRLEANIKHRRRLRSDIHYVNYISYYNLDDSLVRLLKDALTELKELSEYFYKDFEKIDNNFNAFYQKLKDFIEKKIDDIDLSDEFKDIVQRVLERLEEVDNINANASFECLKSTMKIYLQQEAKQGMSANWIVRNFEQIDGDILRTKHNQNVKYHFACLTDEDMNATLRREFPWPLDSDFFEFAQNPVDWKFQVYVKSAKEYRNFKRYALVYGLEFNHGDFVLSYVKKKDERDRDFYYLLKMLGVKENNYLTYRENEILEDSSNIKIDGDNIEDFNLVDLYKFKTCPYKMMLESLIEEGTVYKDYFSILKYMEVMLENKVREKYENTPINEILLSSQLEDCYESIAKFFPQFLSMNKFDVINNVKRNLLFIKPPFFPQLSITQRKNMKLRENFMRYITKKMEKELFVEIDDDAIQNLLKSDELLQNGFKPVLSEWCKTCSNKHICLVHYKK